VLLASVVGAQGGLERYRKVAEATVPLDGREVAVPVPNGVPGEELRVVLRGLVACSYNGSTYDGADAAHIGHSPEGLIAETGDQGAHVAVYRLPEGPPPEAVSAWVDTDRLVTELIITPTEVRNSLSGDLRLEVWQAESRPLVLLLRMLGAAAIVGLAVAITRAWRKPRISMADVKQALRRIDERARLATAAVEARRWDAGELASQIARMHNGAHDLGRQIGALRRAAKAIDREDLGRKIEANEGRLAEVKQPNVREEIEATLAEQRKLRDLVAGAEDGEARHLLRLAKIESALEGARLWLTTQEGELADERVDAEAIEALNRELKSLDEAISEMRVVQRA
jgi:hypothetical protein